MKKQKKEQDPSERKPLLEAGPVEELVLTPGGYRPRSSVHLIEKEAHISARNGRLLKVNTATGAIISDLGPRKTSRSRRPHLPDQLLLKQRFFQADTIQPPPNGEGWVTFGDWLNDTGNPIVNYSGSWIVPPEPALPGGQTIFLFIGIQNANYILQPVLQWGESYAGGGPFWTISNWYADGIDGATSVKSPERVNPGDLLQASIQLVGRANNGYSYLATFAGFPDVDLKTYAIEELTWVNAALEAYKVTACGNYPAAPLTSITDLQLETTSGPVNPDWRLHTPVTECGQHSVLPGADGRTIDLYYRS